MKLHLLKSYVTIFFDVLGKEVNNPSVPSLSRIVKGNKGKVPKEVLLAGVCPAVGHNAIIIQKYTYVFIVYIFLNILVAREFVVHFEYYS